MARRAAGLVLLATAWTAWLVALPARPSGWLVTMSAVPMLAAASWLASRCAPRATGWWAFVRETADVHVLAACLAVALGVQFADTHGVTTDGVIYFSQLRSVFFDRDLDVAAEFAYLGQPPRPYHLVPIGPTLVWLPLYAAVAAVDALGRAAGWWTAPAEAAGLGLTLPYVRAALLSSFAIGAAGLLAIHVHLRREWRRGTALVASLLLFAATPLVWYMVYEPSMTHAASFGFVALFVVLSARWVPGAITPRHASTLGALLGLAFATRPQEALFAMLPACLVLTAPGPIAARVAMAVRLAMWAFVGALPFLAAQALHSTVLFSRESFALVGSGGYLDLWQTRWADTLWSSWHGFLSWSPVAYLAVLGTVGYARRQWRWALAALAILFAMAWVNGTTTDWAAGWSFGGRRFTSCLAVLAPGLAWLVAQVAARPTISVAALAGLAIVWNQLLMAQFASGTLQAGRAVPFAQIVRQQAAAFTAPPFFYPFTFPANAWFAWRTGLPIERYDLLGPETLRPTTALTFDDDSGRFLLDGWGARAADSSGRLRWTDGAAATLVLPLAPAGVPVALTLTARTRLIDPPASAEVTVLINGHEVGRLQPATAAASTHTLPLPADVLRHGFNHVTLQIGGPPADGASRPVGIYRVEIVECGVRGC